MEKNITHIHFQITRNCNLRCRFCGQWGRKGFFADSKGEEITLADWDRVITELEEYRANTGISPLITVWGGEPLVSPIFDDIMSLLKNKCFETEVITNGLLIDKHKQAIENNTGRLYVSIDGTREIHDAIRGKGVYDKVIENIETLNYKNITVMSVITDKLIEVLPEFLTELDRLNIDTVFLQDMIGINTREISDYKDWLKKDFGIIATDIDAWRMDKTRDNSQEIEMTLAKCDPDSLDIKVVHKKHIGDRTKTCRSPFTHPHIAWNGDVLYCTDFYDFTAGNIKEASLWTIFMNERSERFRRAVQDNACPTCNHCSWRSS